MADLGSTRVFGLLKVFGEVDTQGALKEKGQRVFGPSNLNISSSVTNTSQTTYASTEAVRLSYARADAAYSFAETANNLAGTKLNNDGGAVRTKLNEALTGGASGLDFYYNHHVFRRFNMLENVSPQYIILCFDAANNDVNGTITMNRTSGNHQSCSVDVMVSSTTSGVVSGSLSSRQTVQNDEKYELVKITRNGTGYIAVKYAGNSYPSTNGAFFTGFISTATGLVLTAVDSTDVTSVTPFKSGGRFNIDFNEVTVSGNKVLHAGDMGSGSGLDADLLDGFHATKEETGDTVAVRDSAGDINVRLLKSSFGDSSTISGAIAYRINSGSNNFTRYCSNPAAVRDWLSSYSKSEADAKFVICKNDPTGDLNNVYDKGSIAYWASNTPNSPSTYGTLFTFVSTGVAHNDSSNWLNQLGFSTDGEIFYRNKINSGAFKSWIKLAYNGMDAFSANGINVNPASGNAALEVKANDAAIADIRAIGSSQGTGRIYAGQSIHHGGGFLYNGDGTPAVVGGTDDITFFRRNSGTDSAVFSYSYDSSTVTFYGDIVVRGQIVIAPMVGYYTAGNVTVDVSKAGTSRIVRWGGSSGTITLTGTPRQGSTVEIINCHEDANVATITGKSIYVPKGVAETSHTFTGQGTCILVSYNGASYMFAGAY